MGTYRTLVALVAMVSSAAAQPGQTPSAGAPLPYDQMRPDQPVDAPPAEPPEGPQPAPQPSGPPQQPAAPPPGATQVTFVSTTTDGWDVLLDRQPVCATPCSIWVEPLRFVSLRTHERAPIRLDVGYLPQGSVMVSAKPLENGKYAAGITFTALSGMGLATGITLAAVGCATDRQGLCTAGLITGGASAVGLYASILLMKSALPRATLGRAQPYVAGNTAGLAGAF